MSLKFIIVTSKIVLYNILEYIYFVLSFKNVLLLFLLYIK